MLSTTYFKYPHPEKQDEGWGLYALNTGFSSIQKGIRYPNEDHPIPYFFSWEKGRVLDEYQLIYITKGSGIFESRSVNCCPIEEGSVIFLFPNEWHRYQPSSQTGWDEHWVGFKGIIVDLIMQQRFFSLTNPIVKVGYSPTLIQLFVDITEKIKREIPGYQQTLSGEVLQLLGEIYALSIKHESISNDKEEVWMTCQAKKIMTENIEKQLNMQSLASSLHQSYSHFRKVFKKVCGISPGQYFIQLKIERAKELLLEDNIRIKEIAYSLGFDCCFHFSKLFKEKVGIAPENYRKKILNSAI